MTVAASWKMAEYDSSTATCTSTSLPRRQICLRSACPGGMKVQDVGPVPATLPVTIPFPSHSYFSLPYRRYEP